MGDTPRVSRKCEVIEEWNYDKGADQQTYCGKPTAYWYPTQGGGSMALCNEHAQKHLGYASQISMEKVEPSVVAVQRGERDT